MFSKRPSKIPEELLNLDGKKEKKLSELAVNPVDLELDPTANIRELSDYIQSIDHPALKLPINALSKFSEEFEDYSNLRPPSPGISARDLHKIETESSQAEEEKMAHSGALQGYRRGLLDAAKASQASEEELFGQFVAKMLRTLSKPQRFDTMSKMSNILFENAIGSASKDPQDVLEDRNSKSD
ncbi:uncharacterized protein LOC129806201 [Phlebotomus papatasi]|uniref:uncharacterized protein LOC129806201 n=1 Tax=Phlebotomus papatasi TaxID=29031 RepID=UPI002483F7CF|nr:uncharacterized protein LOC129806201 [Phlebotomus papatasi]